MGDSAFGTTMAMLDVEQEESSGTNQRGTTSSNTQPASSLSHRATSTQSHELYLMFKRRFPRFERDISKGQQRLNEDAHGNILTEQQQQNAITTAPSPRIAPSKHYITVPKHYYDAQEKMINEANKKALDQRRKMERNIFVPLQKESDGQWLPMKWDLWRLESWLRSVHGDAEKTDKVLKDMLQQGKVLNQEQVEQLLAEQQEKRKQQGGQMHQLQRQQMMFDGGQQQWNPQQGQFMQQQQQQPTDQHFHNGMPMAQGYSGSVNQQQFSPPQQQQLPFGQQQMHDPYTATQTSPYPTRRRTRNTPSYSE